MQTNSVDCIICINMIHISPIRCTSELFHVGSTILRYGGIIFLYGPFRVNGFMVDSNVAFDNSLKSRNADWGVRDLETVEAIAAEAEFVLTATVEMPVNNLCVIFTKIDSTIGERTTSIASREH
jgi:hypothetical protein